MTGVFAEFLAGYREAMTANALVDLDTLALEIIEPIRPWIDAYRDTPRFERHIHFGPIDFTIRIPPSGNLIRLSKLQAVFSRHTALTAASERALRQQTAAAAAQQECDLAQARTDFLRTITPADRGMLALQLAARAEADARVAQQCDQLLKERDAATRKVAELNAELDTLRPELARLRATDKRRPKVLLAENEGLAEQVRSLRAERQRLKDENRRHKAQVRSKTRAASRYRAQIASLKAENRKLAAAEEELEGVDFWLHQTPASGPGQSAA